jgi:thiol-disulfide isomerase/thioredoxin
MAIQQAHWRILTAVVLLAGAAALVLGRVSPVDTPAALPPAPAAGHPAPDFALATLDGETVTLSELRGQPLVINFWASWCGPCRAEMPELQRLHDRLAEAGVVVLGINQRESPATVAAFRDEIGVDFPTVLDERMGVSREYLVHSLPTTFFVDRAGVIQSMFIGPMSDAVLAEKMRAIYP